MKIDWDTHLNCSLEVVLEYQQSIFRTETRDKHEIDFGAHLNCLHD